jgi:hypothetical protein
MRAELPEKFFVWRVIAVIVAYVVEGGITRKVMSALAPVCTLSMRRSTPFVQRLSRDQRGSRNLWSSRSQ